LQSTINGVPRYLHKMLGKSAWAILLWFLTIKFGDNFIFRKHVLERRKLGLPIHFSIKGHHLDLMPDSHLPSLPHCARSLAQLGASSQFLSAVNQRHLNRSHPSRHILEASILSDTGIVFRPCNCRPLYKPQGTTESTWPTHGIKCRSPAAVTAPHQPQLCRPAESGVYMPLSPNPLNNNIHRTLPLKDIVILPIITQNARPSKVSTRGRMGKRSFSRRLKMAYHALLSTSPYH